LFEPYGSIKEIIVKTKQGSSNSYCFIEYQGVESAVKAQEEYVCDYQDSKAKTLKAKNLRWSLVEVKEKLRIAKRTYKLIK
jgi:RNA recognition motif-containing protein